MVTNLIDFLVASKRITEFLNQDECGGLKSVSDHVGDDVALGYISIKEASFQWKNHTKGRTQDDTEKQNKREEQTKNAEQEPTKVEDGDDDEDEDKKMGFKLSRFFMKCQSIQTITISVETQSLNIF